MALELRLRADRGRQLDRPRQAVALGDLLEELVDVVEADLREQLVDDARRRDRHVRVGLTRDHPCRQRRSSLRSPCVTARDAQHHRPIGSHAHAAVALEEILPLAVAQVDMEDGRVERRDLVRSGDDDEVVGADAPEHARRDLLVAAAEQEALAADHAEDEGRLRVRVEEPQHPVLVEIGLEQLAVEHRIDAERRPVEPEGAEDPAGRRPRADEVQATAASSRARWPRRGRSAPPRRPDGPVALPAWSRPPTCGDAREREELALERRPRASSTSRSTSGNASGLAR